MKILIINETCGIGSHGKICGELAEKFDKEGHIVKIAYGRSFYVPIQYKKYAVKIGNKFNVYCHGILSRLFDKHGLGSKHATKRFLKWADKFSPDLLWLHNIHGYYINYELLFGWIKSHPNIKVKWTLHDCWPFTGHCSHFMFEKCTKWEKGCDNNCPAKKEYPKALFKSNAKNNFARKKVAFLGVSNLEILTPSDWLKHIVENSFLNCYQITTVHNKIDLASFKKQKTDFKEKYGINNKCLILGVSNVWNQKKGLEDFYKIANLLDIDKYSIAMVGLSKKQAKKAPSNVICIPKIYSKNDLAKVYSSADFFLNLTYEDNYPTVNLEAEACGATVITYDTGGCKETISNNSFLVKTGDLMSVISIIQNNTRGII